MTSWSRSAGWLIPCFLLCAAPAAAQRVLWQIGQADGSYADLAIAGRYTEYAARFPSDPVYRIGASGPSTGWPFVHPGPSDTWAGGREHAFRVEFALASRPTGVCRLTIACVNTHYLSPPVLRISVNGSATYRFALPTGASDASLTDPRMGKPHTLRVPFPASGLSAGPNHIEISIEAGSWLLYDCVRLEESVDAPSVPVVENLRGDCTMLFRRTKAGLRQVLRLQMDNSGLEGPASVSVEGAVAAASAHDLVPGPNTVLIDVPPLREPGRASITLNAGGKKSTIEIACRPERRWTVFVAPSAHTDIGYTDLQERTIQRHLDNTTAALEAARADSSFRWNLEVAQHLAALREYRPELSARLDQALRAGTLDCQAMYLNMLTGLCSSEEMVRVLAPARDIRRLAPKAARTASLTDVPTAVGTMPTILRMAGIRYFTDAVNEYRAPVFGAADSRMRQAPFWWEGPDGSRVLSILTGGYAQASGLGLTQSISAVLDRLPDWLRGFERPDYVGDAVLAYGAFSDNEAMRPIYSRVAAEWNRRWAYPRIRVCRTTDFFEHVERTTAGRLAVFRGDMGVYWEDGAASSAYETSMTRWARQRIESAERTAAVRATLTGGHFPAHELREAWESIMFANEHTWGAWCSVSAPEADATREQWSRKAAFSHEAARRARSLSANGTPVSAPVRLRVRNSLPWARDIAVSTPLAIPRDVAVYDCRDGRAVDAVVERSAGYRLVFTARSVPGMSHADFDIRQGTPTANPLLRPGAEPLSWEADGLFIRLDALTGSIASLRTGSSRREWVDTTRDSGLNEFIYVSGGEGSRLVNPASPSPKLREQRHTSARIEVLSNGPGRAVMRIERRGAGVPDVDTFIVVRAGGRLEFRNVVKKTLTTAKEGVYFAFPFRLPDPSRARAYVDVPFGVVEAGNGQLPGACRTWYAANSIAAVTDSDATAIVATPHSPLVTFGDVFRGEWDGSRPIDGRVLSYVMNNYWDTNYCAGQGGTLTFSYALDLHSGPLDMNRALRFGQEQLALMADPSAVRAGMPPLDDEPSTITHPVADGSKVMPIEVQGAAVAGMTRVAGGLAIRLLNANASPAEAVVTIANSRFAAFTSDLYGDHARPIGRGAYRKLHVSLPSGAVQTLVIRPYERSRSLAHADPDIAR